MDQKGEILLSDHTYGRAMILGDDISGDIGGDDIGDDDISYHIGGH